MSPASSPTVIHSPSSHLSGVLSCGLSMCGPVGDSMAFAAHGCLLVDVLSAEDPALRHLATGWLARAVGQRVGRVLAPFFSRLVDDEWEAEGDRAPPTPSPARPGPPWFWSMAAAAPWRTTMQVESFHTRTHVPCISLSPWV